MKKTLLTAFSVLALGFGFAQTATNFNCNDCNSVNHDLFTELNAGKVVVITWAMPCASCIGPASTAANTVIGFSNPKVVFYLLDDVGNTTCSTLNSWATTNSIVPTASFDNSGNLIKMTDYGTSGMPKTIVVGGTSHQVYFNVNGTFTTGALQAAINSALVSGIKENKASGMELNVFPNPANTHAKINYTLKVSADVSIDIMNMLGEKVSTVSIGKQAAGKQEYEMSLKTLSAGSYFVQISAGEVSETVKLTVTR